MKRIILSGVILFALSFITVARAEISLKAELSKTRITTDETITYKLVITSSVKSVPRPKLPKFVGFNVLSSAQSSTLSFQETKIKTILVYTFILAPTDIGKFKIESASVKIKNKIYSTDTFEIEVTPGKTKPKIQKKPLPSLPQESPPESELPQITL